MDEQDYKNLITVYQNKHTNLINQVIALESRELKYRQTIEMLSNNNNQLNEKILQLEKTPFLALSFYIGFASFTDSFII